jgi:Fe(3+) dicitrate transport protein
MNRLPSTRHRRHASLIAIGWGLVCALPAGAVQAQTAVAAEGATEVIAATRADPIVVVGDRVQRAARPGSSYVITEEDLTNARIFTVNEALRQVPGVNVRDEEGLGLRPNIGVRGLSPTRSREVILLEDGLPLSYGLYGDNASYSHPPVRRFARIEVLKGAGQVRFGPHTVGAVFNFITPPAPDTFSGRATVAAGSRGYGEVDLSLGGPVAGFRVLAHGNATQFDGIRDNHGFAFHDLYAKVEREIGANHLIIARTGLYEEDSQVSYSGLTEAEYAANPRGNAFENDSFITKRATASLTHAWDISEDLRLVTSAYTLWFDRDWWRQSSNSGQRPADGACGGMVNINTTCGNEGRLREYHTHGIETRASWTGEALGANISLDTGLRYQDERQARQQVNGDTPAARTPGIRPGRGTVENNRRYVNAWAGFVTARFDWGALSVTPGIRHEMIDYERANLLTNARGTTSLDATVAGIGATWKLSQTIQIYGGVHQGFSPPQVEDVLNNSGGFIELAPEESLNWELGIRSSPTAGLELEATAFVLDFDNQIVPQSVAGGVGSTLTSAGQTRHLGLELLARGSLKDAGVITGGDDVGYRFALTWMPEAEYVGNRFSTVSGFSTTPVTGNRLPYAPELTLTAALSYTWRDLVRTELEVAHIGEQFGDDLNTVAATANGQRGLIEAQTTLNLAVNVTPADSPWVFYATVKNLADDTFIVDRVRGILPNTPRLVQAGVSYRF